jgi:hypothetical protein
MGAYAGRIGAGNGRGIRRIAGRITGRITEWNSGSA